MKKYLIIFFLLFSFNAFGANIQTNLDQLMFEPPFGGGAGSGATTDGGTFVHPTEDGDCIRVRDVTNPTTEYLEICNDGTDSLINTAGSDLVLNPSSDIVQIGATSGDADTLLVPDGTTINPAIGFIGDVDFGLSRSANLIYLAKSSGTIYHTFDLTTSAGGFFLRNSSCFGWDSVTPDTLLCEDSDYNMNLRNGTNNMTFRVSSIHTDADDYQRGFFACNSTTDDCTLGTEFSDGSIGGEEVASDLVLDPSGGQVLLSGASLERTADDLPSGTDLFRFEDSSNPRGLLAECATNDCGGVNIGYSTSGTLANHMQFGTSGDIALSTGGVWGVEFTASETVIQQDAKYCWSNDDVSALGACEAAFSYDGTDTIEASTDGLGADVNFEGADIRGINSQITAGSGTGLTVDDAGTLQSSVYKVTLDYTGLSAAALTATHTIATLPAKTKIIGIIADTTVQYAGTGVTDADITVGISGGDIDAFLLTHDVDTALITVGDADADLGALINRANAVSGGYIDWAGTTVIDVEITTVGANTDQLTAGSTTYYIETVKYP